MDYKADKSIVKNETRKGSTIESVDKGKTSPSQTDSERAVKDTKQPPPTNQSRRKTDPSHFAFDEEE